MKHTLNNTDVVVLAGGLGTRLRSTVSDRPKVMAEINGKPFLDLLINNLQVNGFKRIILSIGYLKDYIKNYYSGVGVLFAEEDKPLGTGGGVKNTEALIESKHFLVMNGDSWLSEGIDFHAFYNFHTTNRALVTVALAQPRDEKDYGAVFLGEKNKISNFNEKTKEKVDHFLNAGVYLMSREVFSQMPSNPFSLESDFFPKLIGGNFYGFLVDGKVVDIGTPERYKLANQSFK